MQNFVVRQYKSGDSKKIYELFSQFTQYTRDDKFWVWINRMLSNDYSLIIVAEFNESIIGHYAVIPQNLMINNVSHKAGFAIHAFVHPDFRNTFLIFQITKMMYKIAKEKDIEVIYGFPNANFRDIQIRVDKWKKVSLFKSLDKIILEKSQNDFDLIEIERNYSDYYILSELLDSQHISENKIRLNKSLNYYINRYINHPQDLYKNFVIVRENKFLAFIVLKIYQNEGYKIGHLIDYISNDEISFNEIINVVESYFVGKVEKLSFWKFGEAQREILLESGFEEIGFETFFGIKMLSENEELEHELLDFKNWELCMGDSDAF